jgi:putative ABC transport system permease protein
MRTWSFIIVAQKSLKSNKVRSILTTLGIIIGVAAVITLIDVTQGAEKMIREQLTSLGGKSFIIKSGKRGVGLKNSVGLTANDAEALKELDEIIYSTPLIDVSDRIIWGKYSWYTVILGTSPDFFSINDWFPSKGNFFNYKDVNESERVCVLGNTVAQNLFDSRNPIGETIRINNYYFKVIGIMEPLGQTTSGKDQDDIVIVPYTTFQKTIKPDDYVDSISVSVRNPDELEMAKTLTIKLLRKIHKSEDKDEENFYIRSQEGVLDRIFTISKIMTILLVSVASISLVVGGIGIMNIMLVSVRERTREIGIRMAVGAKEKDILAQFLLESVLLSLAGGLIGVVVGIFSSLIASHATNWPVVISPGAILLALSFALLVGIFFGIYPARKASKMQPIDALRYE